jgi:hemoglobin-like flavoprotein
MQSGAGICACIKHGVSNVSGAEDNRQGYMGQNDPDGRCSRTPFYERLFEIDVTAQRLFSAVDLPEQRQKLIKALTAVVQGLDDIEGLVPTLKDLGRRHARYGVTHGHYDAVGAALLWTIEHGLGSAWTPEVGSAWSDAYGLLADVMRGTAGEPVSITSHRPI